MMLLLRRNENRAEAVAIIAVHENPHHLPAQKDQKGQIRRMKNSNVPLL